MKNNLFTTTISAIVLVFILFMLKILDQKIGNIDANWLLYFFCYSCFTYTTLDYLYTQSKLVAVLKKVQGLDLFLHNF